MNTSFKSKLFAAALTAATASTMTIGHSLVVPAAAHAGVFGSIKSAANSVGGAVKSTAGKVVSAPKTFAAGTKAAATGAYNKTWSATSKVTSVISKAGGVVANGGLKVGSVIAKTYPAKKIGLAAKGIVYRVQH